MPELALNTTRLHDNLKQLSEALGVSGAEDEVRKLVLEAIRDKALDIRIDPMGSVTAFRKGNDASPLRVMISAHMDESGFMISKVGENGLISVVSVGPNDARNFPAQRVLVGKAKTPGVILWRPIHKSIGENKILHADDLSIDIGADSKGGVSAKPGERIGYSSSYTTLTETVVRGKAFDSRAACAALIELIDSDPFPFDLQIAFTAQRAVGQRGSVIAAHRLAPQIAFILTGIDCNDLPRDLEDDRSGKIRLGYGPVIVAMDRALIADRRLVEHLVKVAEANNIPHQIHVPTVNSTDAGSIGLSRAGVPTVTIGIPVRYINSPNALLNLTDLDNTIRLLREALIALSPALLER